MITVKKGDITQTLVNDVQVAAFLANGWSIIDSDAKLDTTSMPIVKVKRAYTKRAKVEAE